MANYSQSLVYVHVSNTFLRWASGSVPSTKADAILRPDSDSVFVTELFSGTAESNKQSIYHSGSSYPIHQIAVSRA